MDDGSCTPPPQLPPSKTQSRRMGGSSTLPQLSPLKTKSRSMDGSSTSTPPQLPPSEAERRRRSMGGSSTSTPPQLPPNFNDLQQAEPYTWTMATRVRREDGTIQLPPKFNLLQEAKSSSQLPLGLKFTITAEFLTNYWSWRLERATGKPVTVAVGHPLWNKASKIPATSISIGPNFRKESIREDHLTLKLYFARKKLIWEFLEGSLKEKIEVSWSDITAIHAHIPDNQPGTLQIKLGNNKLPLFYRETQPKPLKHTIWEMTTDFTHGQAASRHGIYEAKFGPGVLEAHYPKLLLSDRRLLELSKNPFPAYPNPNSTLHQGESSTTAPCLPSQSLSLSSVNNPTPSNSTPPSQSQSHPIPFPVGVGESSLHMQMQGESSSSRSYAKHQTPGLLMTSSQQLPFSFTGVEQSLPFNMQGESAPYSTTTAPCLQQHQTPLLMPSMSSQQLPFSLITGVEQSLLYNNPTPSMAAASQYLNPAMTVGVGERSFQMQGESSSSRNGGHHYEPLPEELYQYQNYNLSRINNVPANIADQPTMEMENITSTAAHEAAPISTDCLLLKDLINTDASGEQYWLALGSLNYEQRPELEDG